MLHLMKSQDALPYLCEVEWIKSVSKDRYQNPTLSLYTSMVYGFALHLPYSMDIEQPEYVPADFLNMIPHDVEENNWFKWEDRRTYFNAMVQWGDTRKTGMLLQMCSVFQKMLLGEFPTDFQIKEEDFVGWGIDTMTKDKSYNRCFFESLKSLPEYYKKVTSSTNNESRRKELEDMYSDIMIKISMRVGGFKETDANGNIIKETKGTISLHPSNDVKILIYWENVPYYDGIPSIIKTIKEEQLKSYNTRKDQHQEKEGFLSEQKQLSYNI